MEYYSSNTADILFITMLKVLFDSQTGVYSHLTYIKRLDSIKDGQPITLAMIGMNELKKMNDYISVRGKTLPVWR